MLSRDVDILTVHIYKALISYGLFFKLINPLFWYKILQEKGRFVKLKGLRRRKNRSQNYLGFGGKETSKKK